MKINCLLCGFSVNIGECYEDYEGQIKCYVCGALLEIKTAEGQVRSVRSSTPLPLPEPGPARGPAPVARQAPQP